MSRVPPARIAIVGGGLGGLTLARILQMHGVEAFLYEAETTHDARAQGGTLDLHPESGQYAIRAAGLDRAFREVARPEGQDLQIVDKTGAVHFAEIAEESDGDRPEADRGALRAILLDAIDPATIRWGHRLSRATPLGDGRHRLHFANGVTETHDLLIGADGAWSRVRPLLTDARPRHTGVSFIEIGIPDADRTRPALARLVGRGTMMALHDNKALLAQRNGDGRIRVYVAFRCAEDWLTASGIDFGRPDRARSAIRDHFADWSRQLTDLIRHCDDEILPRPLGMLPIGLSWPATPGVTLLGDAAHLMSPFAGAGANLAMRDAADLAHTLVGADGDLSAALGAYEKTMTERAAAHAEESARNLDLCIAPDGARLMAAQAARYAQRPPGGATSSSARTDRPPVPTPLSESLNPES